MTSYPQRAEYRTLKHYYPPNSKDNQLMYRCSQKHQICERTWQDSTEFRIALPRLGKLI
jgi:hypothetical protein